MSYQPFRPDVDLRRGAVWGAGTYLAGLVLTVVVAVGGLYPDYGFWTGAPQFEPVEYVALHGYLHLPVSRGRIAVELAPYRIGAIYLLVGAGYALARRTTDGRGGFKAGACLAAGFLPAVVLTAVVLSLGIDGLSLSDLVGPVFVAGLVYPVLFGGIGGGLASLR